MNPVFQFTQNILQCPPLREVMLSSFASLTEYLPLAYPAISFFISLVDSRSMSHNSLNLLISFSISLCFFSYAFPMER